MAGGGVKRGYVYGATDEMGMAVVENVTRFTICMHDPPTCFSAQITFRTNLSSWGRDVSPSTGRCIMCGRAPEKYAGEDRGMQIVKPSVTFSNRPQCPSHRLGRTRNRAFTPSPAIQTVKAVSWWSRPSVSGAWACAELGGPNHRVSFNSPLLLDLFNTRRNSLVGDDALPSCLSSARYAGPRCRCSCHGLRGR